MAGANDRWTDGPGQPRGARPRVALVHDWLCGYRGGEAVLDRIARVVIQMGRCAGLFVMVDDGRGVSPLLDSLPRTTSILQEIPFAATRLRRHLLPLYPRAVSDLSERLADEHRRTPIDLVISTSSAAVKGVCPPPGIPHLCYCHTPPRYLWSQQDQYAALGVAARAGLAISAPFLRAWDARSADHVTAFLANSAHTAREITRCYGRESTVVYPPVRTGYFTPDESQARENFWLLAGALEPYKRADLAIEAARLAGAELVVAGGGSMLASLRRTHRSPGVSFLGRISDDQLRDLYRRASMLVFPQVEDFGITAVEAQSCGMPVLARRAGGAVETVLEGVTGAFFDRPDPAAIAEAANRVPRQSTNDCRRHALRFAEHVFDDTMTTIVRNLIGIAPANPRGRTRTC